MARFSLIKIFTDTNIIHASQAHLLVPSKVNEYIANHQKIESVELKWYLPEMVVEERRHQMLQAALAIKPKLDELEKLLGHGLGINEEVMQDRIDTKIRKSIDSLGIEVCKLDTNKTDWPNIIYRSSKRMPPFEISGDKEKGFRDAVIAETFLQELSRSPTTPRICLLVMVSGDQRLREYIGERINDAKNVRILDTLDDLKSLLNAISSEITEEYLNELLPKAKAVFWNFDKKDGLYSKEKVFERISEKFSNELKEICTDYPGFRRRSNGVVLGDQTFIRKTGQTVVWSIELILKSKIVKPLSPSMNALLNLANTSEATVASEDIVTTTAQSTFAVEWQHQITTKGNISKPKINTIEFLGNQVDELA